MIKLKQPLTEQEQKALEDMKTHSMAQLDSMYVFELYRCVKKAGTKCPY